MHPSPARFIPPMAAGAMSPMGIGVGAGSPPSAVSTLRCRTVATGGFEQLNYVRHLPPVHVEERLALPVDEEAMTPAEALLAALGSCLAARIRANAVAAGILVHSLSLDVEGDTSASPMWAPLDIQPGRTGFLAIRVGVNLAANAPDDQLRAMVGHAVIWSPVASTIHDPVQLDVTFAGHAAPAATKELVP